MLHNLLKMMKVICLLFLQLTVLNTTYARSLGGGSMDGGGGDLCEDRIQIIREDIKSWIEHKGSIHLKFSKGLSSTKYDLSMLDAIKKTRISCVGKGDKGYPISISSEKTPKICKFIIDSSEKTGPRMSCDFKKFFELSDADQYVLIHHEYAGIAKLENPNKDISTYNLSNQISDKLVEQVIKKLSILPSMDEIIKKNIVNQFTKQANDKSSQLGKSIIKINEGTIDGRNQDGAIAFPIKADDLRLVQISREEITNPWHYADKNNRGDTCSGSSGTISFLVLLKSNYGVHMAFGEESIPFTIEVTPMISAKTKNGSKIENCEDIVHHGSEDYNFNTDKFELGDFVSATINDH